MLMNVSIVETSAAILLRKIKLTETSLIVTWLTKEHGKVKTVAKGALQPKSRFAGRLDLFFECEIQFARSRKSDLHILREVVLTAAHAEVRNEYSNVSLASYFVELIELVTEAEHPEPLLFALFQRALGYLGGNKATPAALLHFENELVRILGIQHPSASAAMAIGRAYHRMPSPRAQLLRQLARNEVSPR
jgi:DNA repair protein RecO (recombination protein O)